MFVTTLRILAIVWFSVSLIGGPVLVVCRAEGDHVGVEVAHQGACNDAPVAVAGDRTSIADSSEPACDDEVLFDAALRVDRQNIELSVPPALPLNFASAFPAAPSMVHERTTPSDGPEMPPWHLAPLASVVLHI